MAVSRTTVTYQKDAPCAWLPLFTLSSRPQVVVLPLSLVSLSIFYQGRHSEQALDV